MKKKDFIKILSKFDDEIDLAFNYKSIVNIKFTGAVAQNKNTPCLNMSIECYDIKHSIIPHNLHPETYSCYD